MDLPAFPIVRDEGTVLMVLQVFEEDGALVCGIRQIVGTIHAPPKAWVAAVREEVGRIEGLARNAGCKEVRMRGRDWSRVFPDYEPIDGMPNGLRKAL